MSYKIVRARIPSFMTWAEYCTTIASRWVATNIGCTDGLVAVSFVNVSILDDVISPSEVIRHYSRIDLCLESKMNSVSVMRTVAHSTLTKHATSNDIVLEVDEDSLSPFKFTAETLAYVGVNTSRVTSRSLLVHSPRGIADFLFEGKCDSTYICKGRSRR